MSRGVFFVFSLSFQGLIYLLRRNLTLFGRPVRHHSYSFAAEEIQDPILDFVMPEPKFVNAVSEIVRLGPVKIRAKILEVFQDRKTFVLHLLGLLVKPFLERLGSVHLLKENYRSLRHPTVSFYLNTTLLLMPEGYRESAQLTGIKGEIE